MTAITSETDICNMALDLLSQRASVASITDPTTDTEIVAARWYDVCRKGLLREYVWRFAKKRVIIDRTGTPAFDWESAYRVPNDFIRLLSIGGAREVYQTQEYDIEGRDLLIDGTAASIKLRYIYDNTNVPEWDALFQQFMAYKLALRMAYKFTLKKGLVEELRAQIAEEEPKLVTINSQERPPRRIQRSRFLSARADGGGGYFTGPITDTGE